MWTLIALWLGYLLALTIGLVYWGLLVWVTVWAACSAWRRVSPSRPGPRGAGERAVDEDVDRSLRELRERSRRIP